MEPDAILVDGVNYDGVGQGINVGSTPTAAPAIAESIDMERVDTWPTGAVPDGTYRITDNGTPEYRQVWMDVKLPNVPHIVHFRLMDVIGDVKHASLRTWDGNAAAPTLEENIIVQPHGVPLPLFHGAIRDGKIQVFQTDGSEGAR